MASIYSGLTFFVATQATTTYADDVDARSDGICGRCGSPGMTVLVMGEGTATRQVGRRIYGGSRRPRGWLLCGVCTEPSVIDGHGRQWPPPRTGEGVPGLPEQVELAYDEARTALAAQCFTSCELICRKLLTYLAVALKASEPQKSKTFAAYVDDLEAAGYLTPPMRRLADHIRQRGNAATHELDPTSMEDAQQTLGFTALLLRNAYDVPPSS